MEHEYKAAPSFMLGVDGLQVTGIFAVHGNVDDGGDRSHPGLFGDFQVAGRARTRFLWQHNGMQPPIATIDRIFEVNRADLPDAVLRYAPTATGGVAVQRTYLSDEMTTLAGWVYKGVISHAITEMSYAYDPTDWKPVTEADRPIRDLFKSDLYDISDVNWGMNPATSADGSKGMPLHIEQQTVRAAVDRYTQRIADLHTLRVVKEGRRFSASTLSEIEEAIRTLQDATTRLNGLIATDDNGKSMRRKTQDLRQEWQQIQRRLMHLGVPL